MKLLTLCSAMILLISTIISKADPPPGLGMEIAKQCCKYKLPFSFPYPAYWHQRTLAEAHENFTFNSSGGSMNCVDVISYEDSDPATSLLIAAAKFKGLADYTATSMSSNSIEFTITKEHINGLIMVSSDTSLQKCAVFVLLSTYSGAPDDPATKKDFLTLKAEISQAVSTTKFYALLKKETPLLLQLSSQVSSSTAREGDLVLFTVAQDVISDHKTIIAKGTPAIGFVLYSKHRHLLFTDGKLTITVDYTNTADGQKVNLVAPNVAPMKHSSNSQQHRTRKDRQKDQRLADEKKSADQWTGLANKPGEHQQLNLKSVKPRIDGHRNANVGTLVPVVIVAAGAGLTSKNQTTRDISIAVGVSLLGNSNVGDLFNGTDAVAAQGYIARVVVDQDMFVSLPPPGSKADSK